MGVLANLTKNKKKVWGGEKYNWKKSGTKAGGKIEGKEAASNSNNCILQNEESGNDA